MRKAIFVILSVLLLASCRSYTIGDGRANISVPEYEKEVQTKLIPDDSDFSYKGSLLVVDLGRDKAMQEDIEKAASEAKDLDPDIIVLMGNNDNQIMFRSYYESVYTLAGTTIMLSDKMMDTSTISLYIDSFPALLAETKFPVLD